MPRPARRTLSRAPCDLPLDGAAMVGRAGHPRQSPSGPKRRGPSGSVSPHLGHGMTNATGARRGGRRCSGLGELASWSHQIAVNGHRPRRVPMWSRPRARARHRRSTGSCSRTCAASPGTRTSTATPPVRSCCERFRVVVRTAAQASDGAEIRTEGDSFYIVFGTASAAVRCGLDIVEAAATPHPTSTAAIDVGVGIHAGEAVETEEGPVGSAVNIAERLCELAGPGDVVVSETVRYLARGTEEVSFEPLGQPRPCEGWTSQSPPSVSTTRFPPAAPRPLGDGVGLRAVAGGLGRSGRRRCSPSVPSAPSSGRTCSPSAPRQRRRHRLPNHPPRRPTAVPPATDDQGWRAAEAALLAAHPAGVPGVLPPLGRGGRRRRRDREPALRPAGRARVRRGHGLVRRVRRVHAREDGRRHDRDRDRAERAHHRRGARGRDPGLHRGDPAGPSAAGSSDRASPASSPATRATARRGLPGPTRARTSWRTPSGSTETSVVSSSGGTNAPPTTCARVRARAPSAPGARPSSSRPGREGHRRPPPRIAPGPCDWCPTGT